VTGEFNRVVMEYEVESAVEFEETFKKYTSDPQIREKAKGYTDLWQPRAVPSRLTTRSALERHRTMPTSAKRIASNSCSLWLQSDDHFYMRRQHGQVDNFPN
jgi:hypothetical protein